MGKTNKKTILITGSQGFVGGQIALLLERNYKIVRYDLKSGQDILNCEQLVEHLDGVDAVLHLAGLRGPDCDTEGAEPEDYHEVNYGGTVAVVKAMKKAGVKKIVFISSGAVYLTMLFDKKPKKYEGTGYDWPNGWVIRDFSILPINDKTPYPKHLHPYSQCKLDTEDYLSKSGLNAISLRVNGLGSGPPWSLGWHNMVDAINKAIEANLKKFEWFNIADPHCEVDISKAEKLLGYKP